MQSDAGVTVRSVLPPSSTTASSSACTHSLSVSDHELVYARLARESVDKGTTTTRVVVRVETDAPLMTATAAVNVAETDAVATRDHTLTNVNCTLDRTSADVNCTRDRTLTNVNVNCTRDSAAEDERERQALWDLYASTNGSRGWNEECLWDFSRPLCW